jgi:hypothetical protein
MNPEDMDRILREARVPERSEDYWREFPARVIERARTERVAALRPPPWRLGIAAALAAAFGLVAGFALWHRNIPPGDAYGNLRDGRVLRELQTRYPGRLQAIVQDGSGLHTQLSESANVSESDPILLEIRDGKDERVVVTFSGQLVRCGDRNLMVLSDLGGQVMLVGDGFFWSRQASAGLTDMVHIRAEQIPNEPRRPKPSPSL